MKLAFGDLFRQKVKWIKVAEFCLIFLNHGIAIIRQNDITSRGRNSQLW